jgi:type IV secretory pathway TraG/TraD family ATPase VirD4
MSPEALSPNSGPEPAVPLLELAHWLSSTAASLVVGLVIGILGARATRRLQLHWSWAACAFALLVVLHAQMGSAGTVLTIALGSAAAFARRAHREDVDGGCDLGELAVRRRTPLDVLRTAVHGVRARYREIIVKGHVSRPGEMILGRDERGAPAYVPLGAGNGAGHVLISGTTGSGKTVTQTAIAARAIEDGMATVVIDPKGDRALREGLCRCALAAGRRFIEWSPEGPSVYNPYSRGTDTEIADKVLASEVFTEPHYQRQAQRYLGHLVRALREGGQEITLARIVEHLDPDALELRVRSLAHEQHPAHAYLDSLTARQRSDLAGVRDRLAILAESDVGSWLEPADLCGQPFELLGAIRERSVVYFGLDADRRPLLMQMLGGAIVQDLQTAVADLQGSPVPTLVVIDEFSALAAEHVVRLFSRARSAGVSVVLATQELADLRLPGRERVLEQIIGNLAALIAHRQLVPDSAAFVSELSGTKGAWKTTRHGDGRLTRTRVREAVLSSAQLTRLSCGAAAVIVFAGTHTARIVHIEAPAG